MTALDDLGLTRGQAPCELVCAVEEFWEDNQIDNALAVAYLESHWDAFAVDDTTDPVHPCGAALPPRSNVAISAERSIGYFQINSCNFPSWPWERFYNARHNAGTAHMLYTQAGESWAPWFFSAQRLGLS